MIWRHKKGQMEHLVFNQNSMRIVYPPSHRFYRKPITMAIKFYESLDWKLLKQDAWRGDRIDEYIQAMHKMYPQALQEKTKDKGKRNAFKFILPEEDSS
jgi:hypothetical protein